MLLKEVKITLCESCLMGEGNECHTPECALFLHNSPGFEIGMEMYEIIREWERWVQLEATFFVEMK